MFFCSDGAAAAVPEVSDNPNKEWFARPGHEEKIKRLLANKMKKQERIKKILEKRKAKALGVDDRGKEVVYKGIGQCLQSTLFS